MSIVNFKTSMPSVDASTGVSSSGNSNMGKYIMYGVVALIVGYGVYKFVIEPRMKANKEYDDD